MKIIAHNHVVMCDVDSTLVMHENPYPNLSLRLFLKVPDPIEPDKFISVLPNEPMIRLLKEELAAGKHVVVWSRGRYAWATNVLIALGFKDYENLTVMSKPDAYLDDKPCEEWMGPRVWIDPNDVYKNKG